LVNYPVRLSLRKGSAFVMQNAKKPSSQQEWRVVKELCPTAVL